MTNIARDSLKKELISAYPSYHHPLIQLCLPSIVGICLAVYLFMQITWTWVAIPFTIASLCIINLIEWLVHKNLFHKPTWPLGFMYKRHAKEHHAVYDSNNMALSRIEEVRLILVPIRTFWILLLFLFGIYSLFSILGFGVWGALFIFLAVIYSMLYEWLHLSFHLPESLVKNSILRKLAKHHTIHHDLPLMRMWNFNVVFPLWDYLLGTYRSTFYKGNI